MKKKWITALIVLCTIVLAGCNVVSEPEPVAVESLTLDATTLTLALGATRKLTATVKPDNADDKNVKWSSSNVDVAMVDNDGTVGAISIGTTTITAQAGGKTATCTVTVNDVALNPDSVAVECITLNAETLTLAPGEKATLTATVTSDNSDVKTVKWSSSNTSVVTVVDGAVTAVAEGTAIITAQSGDKTAICAVTVKLVLVAVDGIMLDETTLTLEPGKTVKLKATVTPDDADEKTVSWLSSDTAIATVDGDGTVTAVKEGTATITARAGSKMSICTVTVKSQEIAPHVHYYSLGICTVCGFQKPFMLDGMIDDNGVLTNYIGAEATVTIPDGVIGIGSGAFENCGSLKKVVIPGSVTAIGSQAFKSCSNLNTVEISAGLTGIGSYAFSECTSLKNVYIPDGVTSIGNSAFSGCSSLVSVTIPTSVTNFGDDAFEKCESLATVRYSGTLAQWCAQICDYNLMFYAKSVILAGENDLDLKVVTTLTIPENVTSIENTAFSWCTKLEKVIIPKSVTNIRTGAFYECENIATVQYNGTLAQWCILDGNGGLTSYAEHVIMSDGTDLNSDNLVIPDGVKSIGSGVFYGFKGFKSVTIPTSVTSIEGVAFSGCTELTSVNIPNSVKSIGLGAFSRCKSLTSVNIPGSVTNIEMMAFYECNNLTSLTISEGVKGIEESAFSMCSNLTSVDIPASVTKIGRYAFSGCNKLNSVEYKGTKEQWNRIEKGDEIFSFTTVTTITCTDGTVAK